MKKTLFTIVILLAALLPQRIMAQEPYAVLEGTTLTFYYDDQKSTRGGMGVGPFTTTSEREWNNYTDDIRTVEFNATFANCTTLESTAYWFSELNNLTTINGIAYLNTTNVTSMEAMFARCTALQEIDLSHFDTKNVETMANMFFSCYALTSLNVGTFNTTKVKKMQGMFNGCSQLTSLSVGNFKTDNVTHMGYMFSSCSNLTTLDLSGFNTEEVLDMGGMFSDCSLLTTINLSGFNTEKVLDISHLFYNCQSLTSLDLSDFKTDKVLGMNNMFSGCTSLTTIYVDGGWSTKSLNDGNNMFYNCTSLVGGAGTTYNGDHTNYTYAHIDGGTNNPGYLTDIREPYAILSSDSKTLTFYYDKYKEDNDGMDLTYTPWRDDETKDIITKVVFDATFADCTTLTTTESWFNECSNLETIENISNLKTENVTNMSAMFRNCTSLTSIDLENFNTSRATTLDNMFFGCKGLTSLDLSSFNTARVEDMHSMFAGCTQLTTLDLSHFDTSSLTNIQGMFSGCEKLDTVDLSSWKPTQVTDIRYMFYYCTNLTTVYVGPKWNLSSVTDNGTDVFTNCINIVGGKGTKYSTLYTDYTYAHIDRGTSYPGYFRGHPEPYVDYDNTVLTFYYDDQKDYRDGISIVPFGKNPPLWSEYCYNGIKTVVFDESFANCTTLTSTSNWFYNCNKLTTIKNIQNLKTDNVEDMQMMFWRCSSLTNIDLSNFNTENVTNMHSMFEGCTMLESIDVSGFNTGKVTDMHAMFYQCSSLKYIFASSFNTENVTNMQSMFGECTNMVVLDLSSFKTDKVTNMIGMFYESPDLTTIYVGSGWSTAGITDENYSQNMFLNCKGLEGGKGTHYKEDHIDATYARIDEGENSDSPGYLTDTNSRVPYAVLSDDKTMLIFYYDHKKESHAGMDIGPFGWHDDRDWNDYSSKITSVVFNKSFANCTSLTSTSYWFEGFDKLTTITGIENLKTDNVKSMISMFHDCSSLTNLDVRNFKTDNVTHMNQMFRGCSSLTNLDVSRFNTANVVDMSFMFGTCSKLTSLDVTNFKTDNVIDMHGMFCLCSGLMSLDVTNFKTDNVTDMGGMFDSCSSLTSLDLNSFNTSKVEYDADNYIWGIEGMFDGCSSLTTIFVGDGWNVENLTEGTRVFKDCDVLVGGKGTTYDANHTDYTYAHIDGGPNSDTPGYFTRSGEDPYVAEPYAVLKDNADGKTLSFYYDNKKEDREGMGVGPFSSSSDRGWYDDRESITSVEFDTSFSKCTTLKSTAYWFEGCTNLTLFSGLDNLKTDNVEDMTYMFGNCFYLRYLDISGFNTGKVTSMMGMFYDCNFLETIFVGEKWNTDNLTNLGGISMFSVCDRLVGGQGTKYADNYINDHTYAHIDEGTSNPGYFTDIKSPYPYAVISDENTKVTFYYDAKRKERNGIWLLYWHKYSESITQVIFDGSFAEYKDHPELECWFAGCSKLTSIEGFSNLNTEKITNMRGMFINCSSLTTLDLSSLNTSNVTTMAQMFQGCSNLESLNISFENTGEVITMQNMFGDCSKLKNLNLSNFNTAKLEVMSNLFSGCSNLESLDISFENTGKVIYMQNVFEGCSKLKSLDLSSFNTENVTHMSGMFSECSSLTDLDLSNFMTNKVENMSNMFNNCSSLATIYVSSLWNTEAVTESTDMFSGCTNIKGGAGTTYNPSNVDKDYAHIDGGSANPGYFTQGTEPEPYAVLTDNNDDVTTDEGTVKGKTLTFYYDSKKVAHGGMSVGPFEYGLDRGWNSETSNITKVVFDDSFANCTSLTSTAWWFDECLNLTLINGISNLKTENVTNMRCMFYNCSGLASLDVSHFKTDNVTNMAGMFGSCSALTSLDVINFKTDNVTDMSSMFRGCFGLTSLDLSSFNTSSVTNMQWMFNGCSGLTSLDINSFNTENVINMWAMFAGCSNVSNLYVNNFQTDNVTNMGQMFRNCSSLTSLDVSGFNTTNVTSMEYMFGVCSGLTILDVSGFNTEKVTDMSSMFASCSSLTSLDVSNFKTDNVTRMAYMFAWCSGLTSLGVNNFKTDNVTSMGYLFAYCSGLTSLDVTNFKTDNVTDMSSMFRGCSGLTSLDVTNFKTDNVKSMISMFQGCSGLTNLDVTNFKTDNVTEMTGIFDSCSGLTSLNVSGFKTDNVTSMSTMFERCSGLTSLDLTNFKTDNVTDMRYMFNSCSNLTTITVGNGWSTTNVTDSENMFAGCTSLKGGAGTTYDAAHKDKEYAHIDGGKNNPGYFTSVDKLGDVNGDGFVNIADAQAMVSYILGTYEGTFNVSLADMNNDGVIDIFDVTLVVNITLEDDTNNPSGSRAFSRGDNSQAEMIRLKAEANNIYLSIDEAERFTAFQFDITLPEGVELTGVKLAESTTDHMLKFVKHRGNRYRVVGLSFTNELLATSNGQLIDLQVSDAIRGNDVSIDNVLFVTPSNKVATHIDGIEHNQQAADDNIYNLSGQKLNVKRQQLSKGVYIINHKKVIIK